MKTQDVRRLFIAKIKKKAVKDLSVHAILKYEFNQEQRNYILNKIASNYRDITYCNPFPRNYEDLCKNSSYHNESLKIEDEIRWYFDCILMYSDRITAFLEIMDKLENLILKSCYEDALDVLDKLDSEVGVSFFTLETELYINENRGEAKQNDLLLKELNLLNMDNKPLILAGFSKLRTDNKASSYFYSITLDQHKKLYDEDARQYLDYIIFKLDPMNYDADLKNLAFIASFDSDFSLVDRYNSLKKIIVFLLSHSESENSKELIFNFSNTRQKKFPDPFWRNLSFFGGNSGFSISERCQAHYVITDLFFSGAYESLIESCVSLLIAHPNYSENYIIVVQSLLLAGKKVEDYFQEENELKEILSLIFSVLEKNENYYSDREKLMKKYYSISHFNFSNAILEFIVNEYHLDNPVFIQYFSCLHADPVRYNFYKNIKAKSTQLSIISSLEGFSTYNFIGKMIRGETISEEFPGFFPLKIKVGYLMSMGEYGVANDELAGYFRKIRTKPAPAFVDTWLAKNSVKCFIKLKKYSKAADLIVECFFKSGRAFDHFYDAELFTALLESDEAIEHTNLSVPILFQIYSQPNSAIYDAIANFLINYGVYKPSEILARNAEFDGQKFNFLLEKCFTKENIEDSPFLNSIEALEGERIEILNYLKDVDEGNQERYNEEILRITKEASIRKGLMQIHESRIYVDVNSLSKILKIQQREVFDRYMDFTAMNNGELYVRKIGGETSISEIIYYFKEPIDESLLPLYHILNDFTTDPNVVTVPFIKYKFFQSLFGEIKNAFVFDEDYGFKSFLSMRIRHGTFSNVLRTVFDKFHLIGSKESSLQNYAEIDFWNDTFQNKEKKRQLQACLAAFSENIDNLIDKGLSWVKVRSTENGVATGMFDFSFLSSHMINIYCNRVGRITDFQTFIDEVFSVLYERLELNLHWLRKRISDELTPMLLDYLTGLQKDIESINIEESGYQLLVKHIVDCSTEVQVVTNQMTNWFKISKNQYIEEFPIELSLKTIIDYMNSINQNALQKAELKIENTCDVRIKGKYFESFGDIFINLFDNAIYKNRDLDEKLKISICILEQEGLLNIILKNNIWKLKNIEKLERNIAEARLKIQNYQNGSTVSFEKGSGYLKLCKSIAVDLKRDTYKIEPSYEDYEFQVEISFELNNLTS